MPELSPTPIASDVAKDPNVTTPGEPAPGGGYSIPSAGLIRTSNATGSKSAPRPNETMLASAPATARPVTSQSGVDTPSNSAEGTVHVVRRGENFWTISRYHYGSGRFFKALWYANRDFSKRPG